MQGVFFRAWTQQQARDLGVSGWVRNCSDGSVEVHLEGEVAALRSLLQRLHRGPPSAKVENVHVENTVAEDSGGFHVRN